MLAVRLTGSLTASERKEGIARVGDDHRRCEG